MQRTRRAERRRRRAAGEYHSLASKSDGTVVGWGDNAYGQYNVPAVLSGVMAIAAGGCHSLALKSDGTVVAWGYNFWSVHRARRPEWRIAIAAGETFSLALKSDGTVVAWGGNASVSRPSPAA